MGTFENKLKEYAGENGEEPSTPDKPAPTNAEYFNWTTTETEATITGFSDLGKQKYNAGEITNLVIPSEYNGLKVTAIGKYAFRSCTGIRTITIPKSVTAIEESTFNGDTNLTTVNFRGTEAQWNAISIGSGNDSLSSATKKFNQ